METQSQALNPLVFVYQGQPANQAMKKLKRVLLAVAWTMGAFIIVGRYLALERLRRSDVLDAMVTIIPSLLVVAFLPGMLNQRLRQEKMVVNAEGIHLQNMLMVLPLIPWSEIRELRPRRFLGTEMIIVVPQDAASLKKRLGWWKWYNARWPGGIGLQVTRLGTAHQIMEQLNIYRAENVL